MDYTIRISKLGATENLFRYSLDSPKESTLTADSRLLLRLRGWFFFYDGSTPELFLEGKPLVPLPTEIIRQDVVDVHDQASANCGFEALLEVGADTKLGFLRDGKVHWFLSISFEKVTIIEGREGYLFLDNDSNKSVAQYQGSLLIDKPNLALWKEYFTKISEEKKRSGFNAAFLMAPGKEYIFPDLYPVMRGSSTPADQFLINFTDDISIIDPTPQLMAERNFTYSKVDTHWSHYGARVAAQLVCKHFRQAFVNPGFNYQFAPISGDLGSKLFPARTEWLPQPDYSSVNKFRIFDNKILNRGRVHIYENDSTSQRSTCLIFGDSFSTPLIIYLLFSFKRVVHVFSGADIDWEIVRHEKPEFLLAEMTTRFFIKAPRADFSLKTELLRKCSTYTQAQRGSSISNLKRFEDKSVQFYRSMAMNALSDGSAES